MTKRTTRGISLFLICLMLLTLLPGAAFARPTADLDTPNMNVLTQTLGQPVGALGFETLNANPDEIIQIAVQFVTPSAVALRLAREASGEIGLQSVADFEAQALQAHDAFAEQLQRLQPQGLGRGTSVEIYSEHHSLFNGVFMRVPAGMVRQIADLPEVFSVTPSERVQVLDPIYPVDEAELGPDDFMREALELFRMDYIHDSLGFRGAGLRVAVLDTGVDYTHPALEAFQNPATGRIRGTNFSTDDPNDIMDVNGHGTHVSGTVIALAPDAELWHYKVMDDFGGAELEWVVSGVEAAHAARMDVINLSLGAVTDDPLHPWSVVTELAMLDGVFVVNAAGNEGAMLGSFSLRSPGSASLPITVGSGTAGGRNELGDQVSDFSSLGPVFGTFHLGMDIVAPGSDIVSTLPGGAYGAGSGTSMAAPHVAGIAVLMIEAFPEAATYEIKARMMSTARPLAVPSVAGVFATGAGFIDPIRALRSESFATVRHDIPWQYGENRAWREATMSTLNFGAVWGHAESVPLTVTIHNPGAGTWTPQIELIDGHIYTGVSIELVQSNTAGAAHTYTYQMRFTAAVQTSMYAGTVVFTNGSGTIRVPFASWFQSAEYPLDLRPLFHFGEMTDGDLIPLSQAAFDIFSTSDRVTGPVQVALTGPDSEHFVLFGSEGAFDVTTTSFSLPGIEAGFWERAFILPHLDLAPGTYTATVEVSGTGFDAFTIAFELTVAPFPFVDVARNSWYFGAVSIARQVGLMGGISEDRFAPHAPLNRAMMAVILHRTIGEPSLPDDFPPIFEDVPPGRWYSEAVNFMALLEVVEGVGNNRFAPMNEVTREQLATTVYRFAELFGFDMTVSEDADLSHFPDYAEISSWAMESLLWAYEMEIIQGTAAGYLNPGGVTTRAQTATILVRFFELDMFLDQ